MHLCPSGDTSGRHDSVNLNTGKVMNHQSMTAMPIADTVTLKVEEVVIKLGITETKFHK